MIMCKAFLAIVGRGAQLWFSILLLVFVIFLKWLSKILAKPFPTTLLVIEGDHQTGDDVLQVLVLSSNIESE